MMIGPRNYSRWTRTDREAGRYYLTADILAAAYAVHVDPVAHVVTVDVTSDDALNDMTPDEARLLGVRLIEGAALADGDQSIRVRS